ncbi:insulin-like peptide INSL5 [Pelobates cultripes]|uniref:Insulin-like peptide INSL5 n=2 Tax=Pelobates cultripes TaxID=61616 RepID=A0AAD1S7X3_PELCU|nr:insulin-like peptide INSL5 [Pelobates cultripes]
MYLRFCFFTLLIAVMMRSWSQAMDRDELGMKLCGREFIRTVVMSCGGSRWKRYTPEPGQERVNPYRDILDWLNRDFIDDPERLNSVYVEGAHDPSSPGLHHSDPTMEQLRGSLYDPLVGEEQEDVNLRIRRSTGPAGSCCQRGCTKTEIMKFC